MQTFKFWQVDAFTNEPFKGNPAAVFILNKELDDGLMQKIAIKMNLSETAFILLREGRAPLLRWFTPMYEIDLCGHATIAASQIYFSEIDDSQNEVIFDTKFVGPLKVRRDTLGYVMNFPIREGSEVQLSSIPKFVLDSLSPKRPIYASKSRDLMLVYDEEEDILNMKPNFTALLDYKDFIIVTAKSKSSENDFISRFFCAADGILEDPVTGSAHCTLAPYWAKQLNKSKLNAYQASIRGGNIALELEDDRLNIKGSAITIIKGEMTV